MSGAVVLTSRGAQDTTVDAGELRFDRFAELGAAEIERQTIWAAGAGPVPLAELFTVRGQRSAQVRVVGDLRRVERLGAGHQSGELTIEGPAGREVGLRMRGGRITVLGNAGWGAGLEMAGGVLDVAGDTGPRAGAAGPGAKRGMTGGEMIVRGSAGPEAGASMRRGLLAVAGDAGPGAGRATIAGTVVVFGTTGGDAGQWSKRGSLMALGSVSIPATYRYACTYRPHYANLLLRYLEERHWLPAGRARHTGLFRRYSGDLAELGAGEILAWTAE
jgi:formylmethanofuran dehydrogenase subunit C